MVGTSATNLAAQRATQARSSLGESKLSICPMVAGGAGGGASGRVDVSVMTGTAVVAGTA